MSTFDQRGAVNRLLLPLILVVLLLFGAGGFGAWAFASRQDYKNNVDTKIAAAEALTKQQTQSVDAATYAQEAKYPLRSYTGPSQFGDVIVSYPKTWSAYVQDDSSSTPINGYFQPSVVPDIGDSQNTYALRVQLLSDSYTDQIAGYVQAAAKGTVTVAPYSLPKVPSVAGVIVTGQIENNIQGVIVILPLRNMTLELWTEQPVEQADFMNIILPNVSFQP